MLCCISRCSEPQQLSRDLPVDAGLLPDKAAVLDVAIKEHNVGRRDLHVAG